MTYLEFSADVDMLSLRFMQRVASTPSYIALGVRDATTYHRNMKVSVIIGGSYFGSSNPSLSTKQSFA